MQSSFFTCNSSSRCDAIPTSPAHEGNVLSQTFFCTEFVERLGIWDYEAGVESWPVDDGRIRMLSDVRFGFGFKGWDRCRVGVGCVDMLMGIGVGCWG